MPAPASPSPARTVITIVMDVLVAVVVVLVVHLVVRFFGVLATPAWGAGLVKLTSLAVLPFGIGAIETPYAGVFDVNAAATCIVLLAVEWVLGLVRRSA